jgi:hypothetical protein
MHFAEPAIRRRVTPARTSFPGSARACNRAARVGVSPTTACSSAEPSPIRSPTATPPGYACGARRELKPRSGGNADADCEPLRSTGLQTGRVGGSQPRQKPAPGLNRGRSRHGAILGMIAHGEDVPWPASVPKDVACAPQFICQQRPAAKLEIYRAMRAEGLAAEQLAQRLGWEPARVTRLFGRRATRLDHIEAALRALGRRLVVTSEAA